MREKYDVCVIGSGPAGTIAAMELSRRGLTVALVESGTTAATIDSSAQALSDAEIVYPETHSPMNEAVRRGLGGTSALWGGRCVPLDPIDHEYRAYVPHSGWPVSYAQLQPYYEAAASYLGAGAGHFRVQDCAGLRTKGQLLADKLTDHGVLRATDLERWSRIQNVWKLHENSLASNPSIDILSGFTCVGFEQSSAGGPVSTVKIRATSDTSMSPPLPINARAVVLAAGGVESTRLVLNSMQHQEGLKPAAFQLVGHFYMGHPSGKIADLQFFGHPGKTLYGFERDRETYVRRRLTLSSDALRSNKIMNIAFWLDNPTLSDGRHKSGILSAAYLALSAPVIGPRLAAPAIRKRIVGIGHKAWGEHVINCLSSPLRTISFAASFLYQRYVTKTRLPGFFAYSDANLYALHFHAEQAPIWTNNIKLAENTDAQGLKRARISLKWSDIDAESIIRAHQTLDKALQSSNIGKLIYRVKPEDYISQILSQSVDGFHQIGSLRMAENPAEGVTDSMGRLFGTTNFFIASSAIFPTSGQANPTLALVALTIRQAEHIAQNAAARSPVYA